MPKYTNAEFEIALHDLETVSHDRLTKDQFAAVIEKIAAMREELAAAKATASLVPQFIDVLFLRRSRSGKGFVGSFNGRDARDFENRLGGLVAAMKERASAWTGESRSGYGARFFLNTRTTKDGSDMYVLQLLPPLSDTGTSKTATMKELKQEEMPD